MPVKKYDRKDREKKFGVKWGPWKSPNFKFFHHEAVRDEFFKELETKEKREGLAALDISTYEAQLFKKCVELVGTPEAMLTLCQRSAGLADIRSIPVSDAVKEYLDEKLNIGRDENYIRAIRNMLARFASEFPNRTIDSITPEEARRWVLSLSFAPTTVKNHRTTLNCFYNWSKALQYCDGNPFKNTPLPDVLLPEPEFISRDNLKRVIKAAIKHHPEALAYITLQAFAGLRSSACARLDRESIKREQKGILIRSDMAKNKRRIFVDGHPSSLWKWIDYTMKTAPEGFEISKRRYDKRKSQIAEIVGFRLPHNGLRHSFCTYHVAMNGDAGKTATLLTHRGNVEELYEHYRGNATQKQGKHWFDILPPTI